MGKYPKYNLFHVIWIIGSLIVAGSEHVVFVIAFQTQSISVVSLLSAVISGKCQHQIRLITRAINESYIILVVMVWSFG